MKIPRDSSPWRTLSAAWAGILLATGSLTAGGISHREIINAGVAGNNSADLLARLEKDVLSRRPEVVVLLVGTNDVLNSRNALSLEKYREGLGALAARITASGAKLLLVTIPPAHAPYLFKRHPVEFYGAGGPEQRIFAANEVVLRVAKESRVPIADFFAAFEKAGSASERCESLIRNIANSGSEDGVHPTAEGYRLLATLVADTIARENLQGARRIVCFGDSITRGVHMPGESTATGETYPAFLLRALEERFPLLDNSKVGARCPEQCLKHAVTSNDF